MIAYCLVSCSEDLCNTHKGGRKQVVDIKWTYLRVDGNTKVTTGMPRVQRLKRPGPGGGNNHLLFLSARATLDAWCFCIGF